MGRGGINLKRRKFSESPPRSLDTSYATFEKSMTSPGFENQKWTKKHEFLIEECRFLHISEVVGYLTVEIERELCAWSPPNYPWLRIVPGRGGPYIKWWFECPSCRRRCENLYVPPNWEPMDLRCRTCHGLIYASQRYGFRHPLRKVLTPRKKATLRKEIMKQKRKLERQKKKQVKLFKDSESTLTKENPEARRDLEKILTAMGTFTIRVV